MGSDSNNPAQSSGSSSSDDMSEYLQVFLDESAEELDALVEATLFLEGDPTNSEALNKAFRMLHSLKGSCGMMGFEVVGDFAHKLEDRFENYRSGKDQLDRDTTTLLLKCVDYFRDFIDRLRTGDANEGDPGELARLLNEHVGTAHVTASDPVPVRTAAIPEARPQLSMSMSSGIPVKIKFKPGLQLADLKARLIVSRLSSIGEVISCEPKIEDVRSFDELPLFSLILMTDRKLEEIRRIASVDGVESIEIDTASLGKVLPQTVEPAPFPVVAAPPKPVERQQVADVPVAVAPSPSPPKTEPSPELITPSPPRIAQPIAKPRSHGSHLA